MSKPKKNTPLNQLSLFGPLRHVEQALQREYSLLTKYERDQIGPAIQQAVEIVRNANDKLTRIQDKRRARHGNAAKV